MDISETATATPTNEPMHVAMAMKIISIYGPHVKLEGSSWRNLQREESRLYLKAINILREAIGDKE